MKKSAVSTHTKHLSSVTFYLYPIQMSHLKSVTNFLINSINNWRFTYAHTFQIPWTHWKWFFFSASNQAITFAFSCIFATQFVRSSRKRICEQDLFAIKTRTGMTLTHGQRSTINLARKTLFLSIFLSRFTMFSLQILHGSPYVRAIRLIAYVCACTSPQ